MSMEINYKRALNNLNAMSELANLQMKNWESAMELAPAVIEVLKTFDGKKITKRLETALQKINPCIIVKKEEYGLGWSCYVYFNDRRVKLGEHWYSINEDEFHFFRYYKNEDLNAEEVINNVNKACEYRKQSIEHYKRNVTNAENILKRRAELINELNTIHNDLHYMFNEYADITTTRIYK